MTECHRFKKNKIKNSICAVVSAAASQQESSGNLLMDWSLSGWSSPVNTVPAQVSSHTPKTGRLTIKFKLAAYVNVRECGFLSKCPGLAIASKKTE